MRIGDLPDGYVARAEGKWFLGRRGMLYNLFGTDIAYPQSYDAECEIVEPQRRVIKEDTIYSCTSKWDESHQTRNLIFVDQDGYYYRINMDQWKLNIAFAFRTTDKRCPWGFVYFTSSSGRFAKLFVTARQFEFRIDLEGNITCHVDGVKVASGQ